MSYEASSSEHVQKHPAQSFLCPSLTDINNTLQNKGLKGPD